MKPQHAVKPGVTAPTTHCNARTRGGRLCRNVAGFRTDHVGAGRCYLHGGKSPIRSGRYSTVVRDSLADRLAQLEAESEHEKLDILPEATMIRALAAQFVEHYDERVQALIAWNQRELAEEAVFARPQRIPDLRDVAELLDRASVVVDRIHRQRAANAISRTDLLRVLQEFGRVVERHVTDPVALDLIKGDWLAIRVG